jgi:hypothetical protein
MKNMSSATYCRTMFPTRSAHSMRARSHFNNSFHGYRLLSNMDTPKGTERQTSDTEKVTGINFVDKKQSQHLLLG